MAHHTESLERLAAEFVTWLAVRNYSETHRTKQRQHLHEFSEWCSARNVTLASEVTRPMIERYQRHLFHRRKKNGKPLSVKTQYAALSAIKMFFKWSTRNGYTGANPASDLEMPRLPVRLPRDVLTPLEAERVLAQPNVDDPFGFRDRAILELFYSTGMRRAELANLKLSDVNFETATVFISEGKGKRDRLIPVGARALKWLQKYVDDVRPQFAKDPDEGFLFITYAGEGFNPDVITQEVRRYIDEAKLGKQGSCHIFRHTMATGMLENGADIRFIQVMLGHVSLRTTEIYTRVSLAKLREIHAATHPAEHPVSPQRREGDDVSVEQLASSLAAEVEEDPE